MISKLLSSWGEGKPEIIVKAPGRINLIGEHTDYNAGFALPAAINLGIFCAAAKTSSKSTYEVLALDKAESLNYDLNNKELFPAGAWQNYIIGVIQELQKVVGVLEGFRLTFSGDIPQGAGLSSSAALENAVVFSLNELFELNLSKEEMVFIAQRAEHNYVGVKCGIMDQLSSMFGQGNKVLKVDFLSNQFIPIEANLKDYELVLINSNITHKLASSEYNKRREECESAFQKIQSIYPEVKSYQDVNQSRYEACKTLLSDLEFKRVQYLDMEKNRVLNFIKYLESNSINQLGEILFDGHQGLKNLYEITCSETDFLVDIAKENTFVIGARQMGGGFGGCTINLVEKGKLDQFYTEDLQKEYQKKFNRELALIPVEISNGTKTIWKHGSIA